MRNQSKTDKYMSNESLVTNSVTYEHRLYKTEIISMIYYD